MTKKDYNLITDSIIELKHSGVSSGTTLRKVIEKLVVILDSKLSKESNYNHTKFITKIYGK